MKTILLDMDDVLVNFYAGALLVHGADRAVIDAKHRGRWDLRPILGLTTEEFWKPIDEAGAAFWASLPTFPWTRDLVCLVERYGDWHIVSSPSRHPSSYAGKVEWLKSYFGPSFDRFALTPHKHIFARPASILIDDRPENVVNFRKHGGSAILFPSRGNHLYAIADDPLSYVLRQLEELA